MRQLMCKVLAHTISFFFFFVRSCSARPRSGHNFIVLAEPHDLSKYLAPAASHKGESVKAQAFFFSFLLAGHD
jgi:hypothetical protein